MFKWIKSALSVGVQLFKFLKGNKKPTLTDLLPFLLQSLFPAVEEAVQYGQLNTKEKIDSWLETFDNVTGSDVGAIDIVPDLSPELEEQLFDHIKEAVKIFAYCKAKIPGFFIE